MGPDLAKLVIEMSHVRDLMERMHITLLSVAPDRLVARMPVERNRQVAGLLFGGASLALAEEMASLGATLNDGAGRIAAGVEVNATITVRS